MKLETIQSQGLHMVHHSLTGPCNGSKTRSEIRTPVGAVESLSYKLGPGKVVDMFKDNFLVMDLFHQQFQGTIILRVGLTCRKFVETFEGVVISLAGDFLLF